jgi:hypothetical protein
MTLPGRLTAPAEREGLGKGFGHTIRTCHALARTAAGPDDDGKKDSHATTGGSDCDSSPAASLGRGALRITLLQGRAEHQNRVHIRQLATVAAVAGQEGGIGVRDGCTLVEGGAVGFFPCHQGNILLRFGQHNNVAPHRHSDVPARVPALKRHRNRAHLGGVDWQTPSYDALRHGTVARITCDHPGIGVHGELDHVSHRLPTQRQHRCDCVHHANKPLH